MSNTRKLWVGMTLTWVALAAAVGCESSAAKPDSGELADAGDEDSCSGGTIVETRNDCLQDVSCVELPDGRYCTGGGSEACPSGAVSVPPDEPCPADMMCWEYSLSLRCAAPRP